MEFQPASVEDFLRLFRESSPLIRAFPGVGRLELHRDAEAPNVFFTLSEWADEASLEVYRNSDLFNRVWTQTKEMFAAKPQAFSMLHQLTIE